MGGHSIDPERELEKINSALKDAEGTYTTLLEKARNSAFISSITYDLEKRELIVTECKLPKGDLLSDSFAYEESKKTFKIQKAKSGKSITNIKATENVQDNAVTLTVTYDDKTSDSVKYTNVYDCRGPQGPTGDRGSDTKQKPEDAYSNPGAAVAGASPKGGVGLIGSAAGRTASMTGVSSSVTLAGLGVTGLSVSVNMSYVSADVIFTSLCAGKYSNVAFVQEYSPLKLILAALGMAVFPLNVLVGGMRALAGGLKENTSAVKLHKAFEVSTT